MKAILTLLILSAAPLLWAQSNLAAVLTAVEQNNTTLRALRDQTDAQQTANRTGIFLPGPEIELNYLWGSPVATGNRTDIAVRQSFDIPTLTGMKARAALRKNDLLALQYRTDRIAILLEAQQYGIALIYCNALKKEWDTRLEHAQTIADSYRERLAKGDANILEHNKALLNLATVQGAIARVEVERTALLAELTRLNGGTAVVVDDVQYDDRQIPPDFEAWFAQSGTKNPAFALAAQTVVLQKQDVALQRAQALPTLSAGYMSERVVGQQYQGISLGLSVPLWENKNRIRQAKAAVRAAESQQADAHRQLYSRLQTAYGRVCGLKALADSYRESLTVSNNALLLQKALDAGEISLLDYLLELGLYYATVDKAWEAERDFQTARAELLAAEL
jgi:outer membrane protein TolC